MLGEPEVVVGGEAAEGGSGGFAGGSARGADEGNEGSPESIHFKVCSLGSSPLVEVHRGGRYGG